jgi:lysophospholipid acyltransferase (LPLAT)-like uncharacterized protein
MLTRAQRWKAAAIAAAGYPAVAALGRTLTWKIEGEEHYRELTRSGQQPILALWHGRILAATLFWRDLGIVALTSENFDGEWVARLMARFGYDAIRGSTSHGGARALVQLRRALSDGKPVAFTVDGPRGPARLAQRGAVWLASATGRPILPFHIEADRFWTLGTWDAAQVPRPFSRMGIAIADPVYVTGREAGEIEAQRVRLERALGDLEARARALALG